MVALLTRPMLLELCPNGGRSRAAGLEFCAISNPGFGFKCRPQAIKKQFRNLNFWTKRLGFLAQVFGIFGSGIGPRTWCRNWTKNVAKLMELMPKFGAEINAKCDCRALAHCGAPIQKPHGPNFWCNFWTTFLDQVLGQGFGPDLGHDFGAILEPKFHENWEKKSAWVEKSHPAKQKKMLAPRVRITMRRQAPRAPIAVSVNACGPCRLIVQCAARS